MSFNFPLKRQNHRVHPCQSEKKLELLKVLVEANADKEIVVLTCKGSAPIVEAVENITVFEDKALPSKAEKKYDLLISFDLPDNVKEYMLRIVHVKTSAVVLLDTDEQHRLYPIETVLGRTILQEIISGFDSTPKVIEQVEEPENVKPRKEFKRDDRGFDNSKREYKPRENRDSKNSNDSKREFKPRENRDERSDRKPRQNSEGAKPWDKKRETSKYIGEDENGKPMFSAKSRERNHRYDGSAKSDTEKSEYKAQQKRARSYNDDRKPWDKSKSEGRSEKKPWDKSKSDGPRDKKPWDKPSGEKKPWDKSKSEGRSEKKPWDKSKSDGVRDKKPWDKPSGEKKPWDKSKSDGARDKKPWDKKSGDDRGGKKPWDKPSGEKKPWDKERKPSGPKKTGKKIVIKSLKLPKK